MIEAYTTQAYDTDNIYW